MAPHSSTFAQKIPWKEEPGRLQSMGSLESDTTERLHFHFSLSCIGEGNGNPLQCSCLENPRDGGAWWAAVYGVVQSWTRLKQLSSSSSSRSDSTELQCPFHSMKIQYEVCHLTWPCWHPDLRLSVSPVCEQYTFTIYKSPRIWYSSPGTLRQRSYSAQRTKLALLQQLFKIFISWLEYKIFGKA